MKNKKLLFIFVLFSFLIPKISWSLDSHEELTFVKDFYKWYTNKKEIRTVESVLLHKKNLLSTTLALALQEDLEASAKVQDQIVGLDFDPFLNSQDPAESYKIGNIQIKKDNSSWVELYEIRNGKKSPKAILWAEVKMENKHWVFTNFHYANPASPEDENLLSVLKGLKNERLNHTKNKK